MASYESGLIHEGPPSDLEVVPQQTYLPYADKPLPYNTAEGQPIGTYTENHRTIFGIRRITFFLLLVIIFLILAGAIGGGVGGSLAVQNARNSVQNTASISATPSTVSVTVTTSSSVLPSQSAVLVKLSCPDSNNTVYPAANGGRFVINCGVDHPFSDLQMSQNVTTLNDCIEHCAYFNKLNPSIPCIAAALQPSLNTCWIKSYIGPSNPSSDIWFAETCTNC